MAFANEYYESHCPLCVGKNVNVFFEDAKRSYLRCCSCTLIFVPSRYWLSPEEEKAEYDQHENDPQDRGYRKFLSRLSAPLLDKLDPAQRGLDFGCGPGPTLSHMLEEHGHRVDLYDPFYYNNPLVFSARYDFICATEVVEHLREPEKEFSTLFGMLKKGGRLGIMTKLALDREAFSQWHYIRDMTHICFYRRSTFEYLAQRFKADLEFIGNDVILLRKRES